MNPELSDLGPYCLQYRLLKNISSYEEQTTIVVTGAPLKYTEGNKFSCIFWRITVQMKKHI